jgi:hypothetical protein
VAAAGADGALAAPGDASVPLAVFRFLSYQIGRCGPPHELCGDGRAARRIRTARRFVVLLLIVAMTNARVLLVEIVR